MSPRGCSVLCHLPGISAGSICGDCTLLPSPEGTPPPRPLLLGAALGHLVFFRNLEHRSLLLLCFGVVCCFPDSRSYIHRQSTAEASGLQSESAHTKPWKWLFRCLCWAVYSESQQDSLLMITVGIHFKLQTL